MFPNSALFWGLIGVSESGINKVFFDKFVKSTCKFVQMVVTRTAMPQILVRIAEGALCFFFDFFFYRHVLRAGVCRAECVHLSALHS